MAKHGGKRKGAGRKTKAEELGLAALIDSVWSIPEQKEVLKKLADDCANDDFHIRHESRKLLLAYKFGKPKDSLDITSNGETLLATFNIATRPKNDE